MQAALAQRPTMSTPERADVSNDLTEIARHQLEHHPHFRGRSGGLTIEQRGGTLYISGRLPSFYLKQLVQEALRHVPGVQGVRNEINVVRCDGFINE